MTPLGHHSRIHLQDNRAILRGDEQRREVSRIVLEQGRPYGLLTFSLPDTHLHLSQFLEATNIPDLLCMRLIGAYTRENLIQALPRLRRETILAWTGLPDPQPADGPWSALQSATLSAAALTSLSGRTSEVVDARRAMLEIIGPQLKIADQARFLGLAQRTIFDLKNRPFDPGLVRAIRLQLGLRQILGTSAAPPTPLPR
jgi:hypothetical protein